MRTKGSKTKVDCWNLKVHNCDNCIYEKDYKTLKEMASDCGFTYNQMVEMSSGRKKIKCGRFDTKYEINKMSGKLNSNPPDIQEAVVPKNETDEEEVVE